MIIRVLTTCHKQHTSDSSMQLHRWIKKFPPTCQRNFIPTFTATVDWLTFYKPFGTTSIIVLMFAESQTMHIYSTCKVCNKKLGVMFYYIKIHILLSQVYCVWQVVKTPTIISNNPVYRTPRRTVSQLKTKISFWVMPTGGMPQIISTRWNSVTRLFSKMATRGRSVVLLMRLHRPGQRFFLSPEKLYFSSFDSVLLGVRYNVRM
jgi:hypothetical protein